MHRELRIAISISLIFFIYGLSSLFSLGGFVTPFFLSKLILVIVSLTFLLMNVRLKSVLLIMAVLAMSIGALMDSFTINFLSEKMHSAALYNFTNTAGFIYSSFFIYYGFFAFAVVAHYLRFKSAIQTVLLGLLFMASLVLVYFQLYAVKEVVFHVFLLIYFISVGYAKESEKSAVTVVSYLFLLTALLEAFKYFV